MSFPDLPDMTYTPHTVIDLSSCQDAAAYCVKVLFLLPRLSEDLDIFYKLTYEQCRKVLKDSNISNYLLFYTVGFFISIFF